MNATELQSTPVSARLRRSAALEYLEYDAAFARWLVAVGGAAAARLLWIGGRHREAFNLASRIHRAGGSPRVTAAIQRALASLDRQERDGKPTGLWRFYESHMRESVQQPEAQGILPQ